MTAPPDDPEWVLDHGRGARIGLPEAIYAEGKTLRQLRAILDTAARPVLLTRLAADMAAALAGEGFDYDPLSRTAILGAAPAPTQAARVAILTAGSTDLPAAMEAARTLACHGEAVLRVADVGVAGLWRLLARLEDIRPLPVTIIAAGMDGALPSVAAGLLPGVTIALPTSVGYGVAQGGHAALHAMLASCAPGLTVVNIDNGYGAACAALRVLRAMAA